MSITAIQEYLFRTISEKRETLEKSREAFVSIYEERSSVGRLAEKDLHIFLDCYRQSIELVTLLEAYDQSFEGTRTRELQQRIESELSEMEKKLREFFTLPRII